MSKTESVIGGCLQRLVRRMGWDIPTNNPGTGSFRLCADCGHEIGKDCGPKDGWQLEDGRTVCHACCVADTRSLVMRGINSPNDKAER